MKYVKKRNWTTEEFDKVKITLALISAHNSMDKNKKENEFFEKLTWLIEDALEKKSENKEIVTIQEVEKVIETEIWNSWEVELFKQYVLYSYEKQKESKKQKEKILIKIEKETLKVVKRNWKKENFDMGKIRKVFNNANKGYKKQCKFDKIEEKIKSTLIDNISTKEITKILIKTCIDQISINNTHWQLIAWRLNLFELYKEASENRNMKYTSIYNPKDFIKLLDEYIEKGLYYKDFYKYYSKEDFEKAAKYIEKSRDWSYNYTIINMYKKRYLLNPNKVIKELPQEMYMLVSMFLAIPEKDEDRLKIALKMYDATSTWKISLPTPTLLNARTNHHQLSSCFKLNVRDDLRSIYHSIENMSQISKFWGWIWVYLWHIRSRWGTIRWYEWAAGWVNPWIKVINDTAVAVNQLWARAWAISVTLDAFHRDIESFLEIQTETWDIRTKSFDVFPAVSFPDLFMERVSNNENWTLFDPKEISDVTWKRLEDHFWDEFNKFYEECENNNKLKLKKTIVAKELFRQYMKVVVETGMPYSFFRDTVNELNPNKHAWNVYSTQLCVEINQNTSDAKFIEETIEDGKIIIKYEPGDSVVCNLASINVAKVNTEKEMQEIIPIAMKALDNVITLNFYPMKESEITAKKYRSVWLWFLGLAEYLAVNKLAYDTLEAREEVNRLFELYSYYTIKASNELSKERWQYEVFEWSEWSKWIFMGKDKNWFLENSTMSDKWLELISSVKKHWLRNWYLLAPAPNTSTSLIIWTTASILPIYKKYFVETNSIAPNVTVAPNLNSENFWYYKEYSNMDLQEVIEMVSVIYKWIDQSISFEWLIDPAKTSPKELYGYYMKTWKKKIKTIYYVRSMSLEVKEECTSCSG